MDIQEIFESTAFWVLLGIGYGAFVIMLIVLKAMDQQDVMPIWVKIATMIVIPIAAALFSGYAEG